MNRLGIGEERFDSKLAEGGIFGDLGPCWLWQAGKTSLGYGTYAKRVYGLPNRWHKTVSAHRYAYERAVGPIQSGLQLDHLCRVRNCVNPAHLEPVTPSVNTLRGLTPALITAFNVARGRARTHCKHGHPFTDENTYITPDRGVRACRTCLKAARQRYEAKARAS